MSLFYFSLKILTFLPITQLQLLNAVGAVYMYIFLNICIIDLINI